MFEYLLNVRQKMQSEVLVVDEVSGRSSCCGILQNMNLQLWQRIAEEEVIAAMPVKWLTEERK